MSLKCHHIVVRPYHPRLLESRAEQTKCRNLLFITFIKQEIVLKLLEGHSKALL